jgi:hypothetical protein
MFRLTETDPGTYRYITKYFLTGFWREVLLLWGKATWMAGGVVKLSISFSTESYAQGLTRK